jgi:putative membrane protein
VTATLAHGGLPEAAAAGTGLLPVGAAAAYLMAVARLRRRRQRWSRRRTASFLGGAVVVSVALSGPVAPAAEAGFAGHVLQHLLLGMLAPLGLALGAPVTLALRTAGARTIRALVRVLHTRSCRVVAGPAGVLALTAGGAYLLHLTPLYRASLEHPTLHHLVHLHLLVSGFLFGWLVAGPDPGPWRSSARVRLAVLAVAVAAHAALAHQIHAGGIVDLPIPPEQHRAGAALMRYGGFFAQLLAALVVVATWRPARSPGFADKAV